MSENLRCPFCLLLDSGKYIKNYKLGVDKIGVHYLREYQCEKCDRIFYFLNDKIILPTKGYIDLDF